MSQHQAGNQPRKNGPLSALIVAWLMTLVGRQLSLLAVPWLVLTTTGSASLAGIVAAVGVVPAAIAGLLGGVMIDRFGARQIAIAANVVSAAGIVIIPLLHVTVGLQFWQLLVAVFIGSTLEIPAITAGRSMVPELASLARQPLERINAAFESTQNLSLLVGPPLAGLLVATIGSYHVLWLDAGASVAGAIVLAIWVPRTAFARRVGSASSGVLADVREGFAFIRRDRVLWPMAVILSLSNMVSAGLFGVIFPVYAEGVLRSPTAFGAILSAVGVGLLAGSTLWGVLAGRLSRRVVWITAFLTAPLTPWVLLLEPGVVLLAVVSGVTALLGGALNPMMVTIRVERSTPAIRGRVFATYSTIAMVTQPIGYLGVGPLIDVFGIWAGVLAVAVIGQAVGIATLLIPGFRELGPVPTAETAPVGTLAPTDATR
ncbi:MAG TPA: MFS transporter [Thermomicrobiales bacterium]|jgi:MFS family permease|nr:MFS transporter [Thermomicrobiales bacterium]